MVILANGIFKNTPFGQSEISQTLKKRIWATAR
jgi:hypothetical protein